VGLGSGAKADTPASKRLAKGAAHRPAVSLTSISLEEKGAEALARQIRLTGQLIRSKSRI
jgi:hypothetical protein